MWIDPRRVEMNMGPIVNGAGRKVMMAAAASLALGAMTLCPSAAVAGGAPAKAAVADQASSSATDFSAAKRRRYYRRGPDAAGLAFMGLAAGVIGTAIAESRRRDYHENRYYYGPGPYYGGPGYYGGNPYYGNGGYYRPRYYYQPY
jgi:hypothetical protein